MSGELRAAKEEGVSCLVDGGHEDMGRNLSFLRQLSQQSGMPIVAGTGFYAQPLSARRS
jgi:predicted metal-dependent phosphotriesterase family hydrolase